MSWISRLLGKKKLILVVVEQKRLILANAKKRGRRLFVSPPVIHELSASDITARGLGNMTRIAGLVKAFVHGDASFFARPRLVVFDQRQNALQGADNFNLFQLVLCLSKGGLVIDTLSIAPVDIQTEKQAMVPWPKVNELNRFVARRYRATPAIAISWILVLGLIAWGSGWLYLQNVQKIRDYDGQVHQLSVHVSDLKNTVARVRMLEKQNKELTAQAEVLEKYQRARFNPLDSLVALAPCVPENSYLTGLLIEKSNKFDEEVKVKKGGKKAPGANKAPVPIANNADVPIKHRRWDILLQGLTLTPDNMGVLLHALGHAAPNSQFALTSVKKKAKDRSDGPKKKVPGAYVFQVRGFVPI